MCDRVREFEVCDNNMCRIIYGTACMKLVPVNVHQACTHIYMYDVCDFTGI